MYVPLAFRPIPSALFVNLFSFLLCNHTLKRKKIIILNDFFFSDPNERAHFWIPMDESELEAQIPTQHELLDTPTDRRMYIDSGEIVRVRVEADEFFDDEPGPPKAAEGVMAAKRERRRSPYTITVSYSPLNSLVFHGLVG